MPGGIQWATGTWQVPGRTWVFLFLSGLATGASRLGYFRALKLCDAARVAPISKLSVVLVVIFAVIFLGEKLTLPNWLGRAPQAPRASPTPPTAAMMTTNHGGAFHAISATKQASASAKSRISPMALVNTGE